MPLKPSRRRWPIVASALFVLVAIVAGSLARGDLGRAREILSRRGVTEREVGSRTTLRLLQRLGALHLTPPEGEGSEGKCPPLRYAERPLAAGELPSSEVPARWLRRRTPVLSIAIDPCRLRQLVVNPEGRGRRFERPAFVSYYAGGELRAATAAGLRLHGGATRNRPRKSFRLYLRDLYGDSELWIPELMAGASEAGVPGVDGSFRPTGWDRLVVHADDRRDREGTLWHFINPLAYDIGRRLGGIAPRTLPVRLVLNGRNQGAYVLTERVDEALAERRFGSRQRDAEVGDWRVVRGRGNRGRVEQRLWNEMLARADDPRPLTPESVSEWVDLENLSRWFATVVLCSTGDAYQSSMVIDRADPQSRWRWVHWDFDMSFRVMRGRLPHGWQRDPLRFVLRGPAGRNDPTRLLLYRLLSDSPEYRHSFAVLVTAALNHRLTPDFLDERFAYYEAVAADLELDRAFLAKLRTFFDKRPGVVRRQLRQALELGPFHRLTVAAPPSTVEVDGFDRPTPYEGRYFEGMECVVRLRPEAGEGFLGWAVDGEVVSRGPELRWTVDGPVTVEARFRTP